MIPFFVRRYNDIDHLAPVVYRMAQQSPRDVIVLCNEPSYDITRDPRLRLLRDMAVTVEYTFIYGADTAAHRAAAKALCGPASLLVHGGRAHRLVRDRVARTLLFDQRWAARLLARLNAPVAVFDWAKPAQNITGALIDAARALGIRTVGLPHGLKLWTVDSMDHDDFLLQDYGACFVFDDVVVPNDLFRILFAKGGIPDDRLHVLGSARFCSEWQTICNGLEPAAPVPPVDDRGKLKVLFLEGGHRYLTSPAVMATALDDLAACEGVQVIVKPKTASSKMDFGRLPAGVVSAPDTSTVDLCRWSDVVITTCTSAVFEAYAQDKTVMYPRYFYTKTAVFDAAGAAWCVSSPTELKSAMAALVSDRSTRPYTAAATEAFLADMVYGGDRNRDVLGEHVDLIAGPARQARHAG